MVIKNGITTSDEYLISELKQSIRKDIGAIASLKELIIIDRLPKTRSGKILRKTLRQMIEGKNIDIPSTIEDSQVITELSSTLMNINKGADSPCNKFYKAKSHETPTDFTISRTLKLIV